MFMYSTVHDYCIDKNLEKNCNYNEELKVLASESDNAVTALSGDMEAPLGHQCIEHERICDVLDGNHVLAVSLFDGGDHYDDLPSNFRRDHARKMHKFLICQEQK